MGLAWASGSGSWNAIIKFLLPLQCACCCAAEREGSKWILKTCLPSQWLQLFGVLHSQQEGDPGSPKQHLCVLQGSRFWLVKPFITLVSLGTGQAGLQRGIYGLIGKFKRLFYKPRQANESRPSGQISYKYNPKTGERSTTLDPFTGLSVEQEGGGGGFQHTRMASGLIRPRWDT